MAKSSRSSARKTNAHRRATNINGPAEAARAERLHAKLLEVAKQPKPESSDVNMDAQEDVTSDKEEKTDAQADETSMDVDSGKSSKSRVGKKRIDKRKQKKAGIVFKKYSDRRKK